MTHLKKQKPVTKKTVTDKNSASIDTRNKSPYLKQKSKKKFNEFGDSDAL